jgi:RND family efflux transporter MFP subunit
MKTRTTLYLFQLIFLLVVVSCNPPDKAVPTGNSGLAMRIPVKTAPVVRKLLHLPITGSGILTSTGEQRLSFKIGGIIRAIAVKEGDHVRAGQLLASLDKTEIDAQVRQANEALAKAERDLKRVEALYRDSSATLEWVQNATTARDIARETAQIAGFNRQYAEIRASKAGKIIKVIGNEGEIIGPGMPVLVEFAAAEQDWVVRVQVSDRNWAALRKGMPATVEMDAYPNDVFNGTVTDMAVAADPTNGLYPIEIKVTPGGKRFAPGLFSHVFFPAPQGVPQALVPVEAILEGDGTAAFVFVPNPTRTGVIKVPVTIAYLEGRQVVLRQFPEDFQEVVTAGAAYLSEKAEIIIQSTR